MKLRELKRGQLFTLKPIDEPKEEQVYIKGEYIRSEHKYECVRYDDIFYSRLLSGYKEVYTDFIF